MTVGLDESKSNVEKRLEFIESEIKKQFHIFNYCWFVNHPKNKSIPEIWHCHIFFNEN